MRRKQAFSDKFPDELSANEKFFSDLTMVRKTLTTLGRLRIATVWKLTLLVPSLYRLWNMKRMTVGEYLDELTSCFELQLSLIANMGYFHDNPYELSMLLMAGGQASYLTGGSWFIKGGSQQLSNALSEVITENGGEVITKHFVEEITVDSGRATGITYRRKTRKDAELKSATVHDVILNRALPTVTKLIPSLAGEEFAYQSLAHGYSLFTIYLSFSEPVKGLTNGIYSTFIYDLSVTSLRDMGEVERSEQHDRKGFVYVNYGAVDSGL